MSKLRFVLGLLAASLSVTLFNFSGFAAEYSVDVTVNDAEKGYADQYKGDKRPVTLVGVNFRTAKRNIDEPAFGKG